MAQRERERECARCQPRESEFDVMGQVAKLYCKTNPIELETVSERKQKQKSCASFIFFNTHKINDCKKISAVKNSIHKFFKK